MNQHVVFIEIDERIAIVDRQMLQPWIRGLDDDAGFESGSCQHALDAEHFVADGVAISERRQDLMNAPHQRTTGPTGNVASTSSAAGILRRRRARNPGKGSSVGSGSRLQSPDTAGKVR